MNDTTQQACPMAGDRELAEKIKSTDWALGPGSVTWKVLRDPSVFVVGMLSTSLRLLLHPPFAATAEFDSFGTDPAGRFKRIVIFIYMAAYGSVEDAKKVAKFVVASHNKIKGTEPTTQLPFQANSEYELAMTLCIQTMGFLATYEKLYGELPLSERDQFIQEQKVLGATIGIEPDHVPSTYYGLVSELEEYRKHFAAGFQAREALEPFDNGDYPAGTVMGDLPWLKKKAALYAVRLFSDMSMSTMNPQELFLLSINRRPVLFSKTLTNWAFRGFSKFMQSERGGKMFDDFMGEKVAKIYRDGLAIDAMPGHQARKTAYKVPDPRPCLLKLPDLVKNWPGSPSEYRLGGVNGEAGKPDSTRPLTAVGAS